MTENFDNMLPQVRPRESAPFGTEALAEFDGNGFANAPAPLSTHARPAFTASMLLRRKWLIFGVFLLVASASIPCIWKFTVPKYVARATVQVSARVPRIVFDTEYNGIVPLYKSFLNTQVSKISGRQVLELVLLDPEVMRTQWFGETPRTIETLLGTEPPSKMERLRDALEVSTRRDTELIDVAFTATRPGDAQIIVDTVVDKYDGVSKAELKETEDLVFKTLRDEKGVLGTEIKGKVEEMGELSKKIGTFDPDIVRSQLALRLSELETVRGNLRQDHALTLWELQQASRGDQDEETAAIALASNPSLRNDVDWRRLKGELLMAEHAIELERQRYGEAHPRIKELLTRINQREGLLRERETELTDPPGVANRAQMTVGYEAATAGQPAASEYLAARQQQELDLLEKRIGELRKDQSKKGDLAKDLAKLDEDLQHKRQLYERVHQRLTALDMELKAPGRIRIAGYAITPSRPEKDRRIQLTLVALCGAVVAGIGAGYLRATMDTRICEASEVQQTLMVPFLGQLPQIPTDEDLLRSRTPMIVESVRMVRTALLERLDQSDRNVVLITSSTSQNGKTTVAALLARSLAQLGKRTLLVEADLRRPSLGRRLGLEADFGLASVLSGEADDGKAIGGTCVPNLDLILAGNGAHPAQSEALANGILEECLDRWRSKYDFVLLDAPPVLPVADARILAGRADGTILVLRSSHTRRGEVVQAYADLSAAGAKLLGTVLVDTRSQPRYGYYGGYRAEAEETRILGSDS